MKFLAVVRLVYATIYAYEILIKQKNLVKSCRWKF